MFLPGNKNTYARRHIFLRNSFIYIYPNHSLIFQLFSNTTASSSELHKFGWPLMDTPNPKNATLGCHIIVNRLIILWQKNKKQLFEWSTQSIQALPHTCSVWWLVGAFLWVGETEVSAGENQLLPLQHSCWTAAQQTPFCMHCKDMLQTCYQIPLFSVYKIIMYQKHSINKKMITKYQWLAYLEFS